MTGDCVRLCRDLVRLTEAHKAAEERRFAKVAETLARADADHAQVTYMLSMFFVPFKVQWLCRTAELGVQTFNGRAMGEVSPLPCIEECPQVINTRQ